MVLERFLCSVVMVMVSSDETSIKSAGGGGGGGGWAGGVMKRAVIYRLRRYGAPGSLTPFPVFVWTRAGPRAGAGCLTSAVPGGGGGEETAAQSRKPLSPSRCRGANVSETYCVPMATPWKEQPLRSSLLFCVLQGGSVTLAVKEVWLSFFLSGRLRVQILKGA